MKSVLNPSAEILKGYETRTVVTADGKTVTGLFVESNDNGIILRNPTTVTASRLLPTTLMKLSKANFRSCRPDWANQLTSRQQFLD